MSDETTPEDFGLIRELMNQDHIENPRHLFRILTHAHLDSPEEYKEQWIPYLRGFPNHWRAPLVNLSTFEALRHAVEIAPFATFSLSASGQVDQLVQTLATSPYLANISVLKLSFLKTATHDYPITSKHLYQLTRSSYITNLRGLELWSNAIADDGLEAIANAEGLASLEGLNISADHVGDSGVIALANSPFLSNLVSLKLWKNHIGNQGVTSLANSKVLQNLELLSLGGNNIGNDGALALASSPYLTKLKELDLWKNQLSDPGVEALASASQLETLETLLLGGNAVGSRGIHALATCDVLKQIKKLGVDHRHLPPQSKASMEAMAKTHGIKLV